MKKILKPYSNSIEDKDLYPWKNSVNCSTSIFLFILHFIFIFHIFDVLLEQSYPNKWIQTLSDMI